MKNSTSIFPKWGTISRSDKKYTLDLDPPPSKQYVTVTNEGLVKFSSESPNLKMSCHPIGDWHPGWEKNHTPRHLQPAKDPSQRTTRPPWGGGTRVPMGWMVQGRWWWRPERRFLPIKNNGCFFGGAELCPFCFMDRCPCSICLRWIDSFSKRRTDSHDMARLLGMILPAPKRSFKSVCMFFFGCSTNHHNPFNPNPNWRTTAINKGKLQTNSTSLPPYPPCHLQASPLGFCHPNPTFPHPNESQSHSPPVVMADLEWSWMETRYKPWSPETEPKTGETRRNRHKNGLRVTRLPAVGGFNPSEKYESKWTSSPKDPGWKSTNIYINIWVATTLVFLLGMFFGVLLRGFEICFAGPGVEWFQFPGNFKRLKQRVEVKKQTQRDGIQMPWEWLVKMTRHYNGFLIIVRTNFYIIYIYNHHLTEKVKTTYDNPKNKSFLSNCTGWAWQLIPLLTGRGGNL